MLIQIILVISFKGSCIQGFWFTSITPLWFGTWRDRTRWKRRLLVFDFVTLRIATKLIESPIYNIRCFGVWIDFPYIIFCDNKLVVANASVSDSLLNERHNAICYHILRKSQVVGNIYLGWIPGERNPS